MKAKAAPPPDVSPHAEPLSGAHAALLGFFLAAFVAALNILVVRDTDTWWHLKTGEWIWAHHAVPTRDLYSYAIEGSRWVAFEWLSQAIFWTFYKLGGFAGLILLKTAVVSAAFLVSWRLASSKVSATIVFALAALCVRDYFVERPQIFDLLFLGALTTVLWNESFAEPRRRLLWVLPALVAVWVNVHGGAAALVPAFVAIAACAARLRDRRVPLGFWALVSFLCLSAMLLNPQGPWVLEHLWKTLTFPGKDLINEWKPPTPGFKGFPFFIAFVVASAWAVWKCGARRPFAAAWTVVLGIAAFSAVRNILLFVFCAAPLIAEAVGDPLRFLPSKARGAAVVALCAALAAAATLHTVYFREYLIDRLGFGTEERLAGAVEFLDRENVQGRMFNEYASGGYLIWKAWPKRKVFVDGRNVEYGPEFIRLAVRWNVPANWRELTRRWQFDYAVITAFPGVYTAGTLDSDPDWQLAYWDDAAFVYLRKTPANAGILGRLGYEFLRPNMPDYSYLAPVVRDPVKRLKLLAELDRAIAQAPACVNALLLKANVYMGLGRRDDALELVQKTVALFPRKPQPLYTLGWHREARGDKAGAEEAYRRALDKVASGERKSIGADLRNNLGVLLQKRGDYDGARREYRAALRWNPAQADARRNLDRLGK
ncbi:MAG: tetratricopeptide repeat protein [Proteobacteria bacterium]|nr:tetratricopeptide repeat protein [Pseudomonadota bacterium]